MNACMYVVLKQWKHSLQEKIRRPQFWIGVLVVAAYFALYIYQEISHTGTTQVIDNASSVYRGSVTMVFLVVAFVGFALGLNRGSSFFRSADINHMFVAPIRSERILFYGILKKCGISVLITLILLMQLTNLRFYFGLGIEEMLILMGAWLLLSICLSILSLAVYSITAVSPVFRKIVLIALYAVSGLIILGVVLSLWRSGTPFSDIFAFFNDPRIHAIPLGGWAAGFLCCAMDHQVKLALVYAGLLLIFPLIGIIAVLKNRSGYYEDVLTSIGHGYGNYLYQNEASVSDVRHKVTRKKSHLMGRSRGEIVLMQRQMTEQKRSFLVLFDRGSLGMLAVAVLTGSVLRSLMIRGMYPFIMQIIALAVLCYTMIFTIPMGKFVDELRKPFIFLIPGKPLKKLFFASLPSVLKAFIEGLICLVVVSLFAKLHPAYVLCGSMFYASSAMLFYAVYMASIRTLGLTNSRQSHMILAFAILSCVFTFELSLGANIGSRLYAISDDLFILDFLILAVFNMIVSLFFFVSSRSILDSRD